MYYANAFVRAFAKLTPFDHRIVEEVDLSHLKPIFLALLLGNAEEKEKTRKILLEVQESIREPDERKREINLINWLLKTKESVPEAFPRLKKFEGILTVKLSVKKGILSATTESVKYLSKIIAIVLGITTIISIILGLTRFLTI